MGSVLLQMPMWPSLPGWVFQTGSHTSRHCAWRRAFLTRGTTGQATPWGSEKEGPGGVGSEGKRRACSKDKLCQLHDFTQGCEETSNSISHLIVQDRTSQNSILQMWVCSASDTGPLPSPPAQGLCWEGLSELRRLA